MDIDKFKNVPNSSSYLKNKVDKLHVDKLVPVPVDLSKLSDVVKNDVVEKDVYNAKIKNIEHKIPDITNVATNTTLNAKLNDIKNKIPDITNLAATAAFTAVGKKVPCVSGLIKKSRLWCKNTTNGKKYFTACDYNKCTSNTLDAKVTQKNYLMNLI